MPSYEGVDFETSMRSARRADGCVVVFTRQERTLLLTLTRRAGAVVTRSELAQSLSQTGREAGERNVDFLVNKLRRHLKDDAREPRFVATQYGEGYVWVAQETRKTSDAFLVLGPLQGEVGAPLAQELVAQVHRQLASLLGGGRAVVIDASGGEKGQHQYGLALACIADEGRVHGVLTLTGRDSPRALASVRLVVERGHALPKAIELARWVRSSI
ncbi:MULTISPECIES: helix-turn-helix domain-containing protein [unclassified Devosia]|uniref:winged helix-turn-helix domain-containing protein n=1 Tax=unclassified Devosia TaxID=196773 RepID=UPI00145F91E6|nr:MULTISPECIES: helix-turn-helix domain-containing protein [unclassified Devosia]MBJ6986637.1 winged helix-turn-helix domain-containing protein [Devosia sp. MC521]QMW61674.1 winged helix-turn-helix domain-containing protein [Devosia sp. MC521]